MGRISTLILITVSAVMLCGCNDGSIKVHGKLQKGGSKLKLAEGRYLDITLVAVDILDEQGKSLNNSPYQAVLDEDGESFHVPGPEGHGIRAGKYRVIVLERMTREAFDTEKPKAPPGMPKATRETDFFWGRFGVDRSPIYREITDSSEVVIDLDKP